ncbi:hypothetical protein LEP1GSC151_2784 [Leptospira interrogans serovar Grippotyphosa str. LT2186]|uniref:Uncharacterized protein n=1 Tax=Leptospira interrogans serovar Grippotyphosa str. LT2186 TaxID=1001599 RepID=M3GZP3_LEPIR|nr:hypothetical protein [Leptospira interrogans]EMG12173.1 hypothetical protein LEP1GSC151_2784 [Leptospira interrogans serovar Grippotyphosa str. LT2186]EKR45957.1 hypothetical protein LEP1GSC097_0957 [Leptospira interrogans serovar Grippotyphosa str. UI 08368]EMN83644.1 hypothetical protein LEP1GSC107_1246 [Leptospira interrogans serovar Grippotyphosa str. UI 12769]MCR8647679.1 hypothetical protein [Leptospira interrogans serovar Bataviae]OAM83118.1 hypothetical protein A1343_19540 [Leptospi
MNAIKQRAEIQREIVYRYKYMSTFAKCNNLNERLTYEFFSGRNNNRRVIAALKEEGFKDIELVLTKDTGSAA